MIIKNYKNSILIAVLIICALCAFPMANKKIDKNSLQININATAKTPLWNCTWDASEGLDIGRRVAIDSSDNIYVVGRTETLDNKLDALLIKYNIAGTQIWNVTFDLYDFDSGYGITIDSLDNIYIVGSSNHISPFNASLFCAKFNANGELIWNVTGSGYAEGYGTAVDSFDNVYVMGRLSSNGWDVYLIKYSSTGVKLWETNWGGSESEIGWGVVVDSSDNLYITGSTDIDPTLDHNLQAFLAKYNTAGQQIWNTTWGYQDMDQGFEVKTDSLGYIYVVGYSDFNFTETGENLQLTLTKFDSTGNQLWNLNWGDIEEDIGIGLCIDSSDDIYVTGYTDINFSLSGYDYQACLFKYDWNGNKLWETIWGGGNNEIGYGVTTDSLDNIYVVGAIDLNDTAAYNYGVFLAMFPKDESVPGDSWLILIIILSLIGCVSVIGITIFIKRRRY